MGEVSIVEVDERDSGWEDDRPRFRVYLHESGKTSTHGATATYDITGADVVQVLDWAQRRATGGRTYAVALVRDEEAREGASPGTGRGLVWLVGRDGNDIPADPTGTATQQRMLARRADPLQVPEGDRMPSAPGAPPG